MDRLDIVEWLNACYDRAEIIALAASAPYQYTEGEVPTPPDGVRWQWGTGENSTPVEPDPVGEEYIADGDRAYLLSRETWPARKWTPDDPERLMPRSYLDASLVDSAAGLFIIQHDPAWRIADIRRKRAILAEHADQHECTDPRGSEYPYVGCRTVRLLAEEFAGEPGYRAEEWRP